jgi:uncharacterized damage-inducible protein DinB
MSAYTLDENLKGITHEESMRRIEPGGNFINWILGHIVRTQVEILPLIGVRSPYPLDEFSLYRGDPNVAEGDELSLGELQKRYGELRTLLDQSIGNLTAEDLDAPAPFSPTGKADETVGTLLATIAYHEGYHAGQIGMLRRALGRPGVLKVD